MLGAVLLLAACKKEGAYDITGDPEIKFFTNNEAPGNAPINSLNYWVVNIPAGNGWQNLSTTLPEQIKIPVFATRPVPETVDISAEIDNSLIASYNSRHNTDFKALPAGVINPGSFTATIQQGQTISSDSITIPAIHTDLGALTEVAYMVPVRLTQVSKPSVGGITANALISISYIVVYTELRQVRYLATEADIPGTLATNRSSWEASFSPAPTTTGSIFDNNANTFTRWGSSTVGQADINLQEPHKISGIRLLTTTTAAQRPLSYEVWLSNDGINYTYFGRPMRNDVTFAGGREFIGFYHTHEARYVRLILTYGTGTNTQNRRLNEFDLFVE